MFSDSFSMKQPKLLLVIVVHNPMRELFTPNILGCFFFCHSFKTAARPNTCLTIIVETVSFGCRSVLELLPVLKGSLDLQVGP